MRNDIRLLLDVQQYDQDIAAEKARQKSLRETLTEHTEAVEDAKKRVEDAEAELHELKKEVDRIGLEIKGKEEQVQKDQDSLKQLSSNKEYKAMLTQIEKDRADLSVLEDEALEAMTKVDQKQVDNKRVDEALKDAEADLKEEEAEVEKRVASSQEKVVGLEAKRKELASGVDPELLGQYNRLAGRGDGRVVVSARGGSCAGCNITLRAQMVSELMADNEIICCTSCGRILYLDNEQEEE
jgi:predicted  nucleic acid-binding Zn-ribbon protein